MSRASNLAGFTTSISPPANLSVGIITASSVINVGTGLTLSSSGINVSGVITATSFSGNGSGLTGVAATTLTIGAGTTALPSISPTGDSNTGIFFPSADTIAFAEGGTEAMRVDSSGRLLIGTSSANANGGILQLSGGITFPATAVAASDANTLDDYEEGTWTPVYTGSGGSIGATAYTQQAGTYTKIGRQVTAHMRVALSSKGSWTGTVIFTGLPFTSANNSQQNMGSIWTELVTFADQINARVGPNEATIVPRILTSTTGGDYLQTSGVTNTSTFYATVTYFI